MSARLSVPVIRYSRPMPITKNVAPIVPMTRYWYAATSARRSLPQRDQHVGRQRRDLEEHEEVEGVAGDRDAEQPGQAQREHRVEEVVLLRRDFRLDAGAAVRQHDRRDARDQDQHEGAELVDAVLDAPWRRPVADGVGDRPAVGHAQPQRTAIASAIQLAASTVAKARPRAAHEHDQRRGHQRQHDLQRRQMLAPDHCSCGEGSGRRVRFRISSSSMCRRPRGCAPRARARAPAWRRRRRWR